MKDLLNAIRQEREKAFAISNSLLNLSNSFFATGNEKLSEKLVDIAGSIERSFDRISNEVGKELHRQFNHSEELSHTVLKAALAGTFAKDPKNKLAKKLVDAVN